MLLLGDDPIHGSTTPPGARRAVAIALSVIAGIALTRWLFDLGVVLPAAIWCSAAGVLIALALLLPRRCTGMLFLCASLLLACGWSSLRWFEPSRSSLAGMVRAHDTPLAIEVEGAVSSSPRLSRPRSGAMAMHSHRTQRVLVFELDVHAVRSAGSMKPATGSVTVIADDDHAGALALSIGDEVRVLGVLTAPSAPMNPGVLDRRLADAEQGRAGLLELGVLKVVSDASGRVDSAGWWSSALGSLERARSRARAAVLGEVDPASEGAAPSPSRAVVGALVLGEREPGSEATRAAFARQGVAHLLAISGFHLVLVCAAATFAVRTLTGGRFGWAEPMAMALVVAGYLLLVPARPPIVRSGVMVMALLAAEALGRRHHGLGVISWVCVAMLAWRPSWLFETGFQFSFLMTASLIWLGSRVDAWLSRSPLGELRLPPDVFDRAWWVALVRRPISAGLVCWVVAAPIVAARFGWLSPLAVISTVVLMPIVAVVLVVGAAAAVLGAVGLEVRAAGVLEALAQPAAGWVEVVERWSLSHVWMAPMPQWLGWIGVVIALAWLGGPRSHRRLIGAVTACWCVGVAVAWAGPRLVGAEARLHMFAVGDGTCMVVQSRGEALLWDAGSTRPDLGVWELPTAIRAAGIGRVRTAVITHANFDHYSLLPDLIEPLGIERVLVSEAFTAAPVSVGAAELLDQLADAGVAVEVVGVGDVVRVGRAHLEVVGALPADEASEVNDRSLVVRMQTPGGGRVLLTGDIQETGMRGLAGTDVRAHVLELPHHGSVHAEAMRFVQRVKPMVVLQSTGRSRLDGERWSGVRGTSIWRASAASGWTRVDLYADELAVHALHLPSVRMPMTANSSKPDE